MHPSQHTMRAAFEQQGCLGTSELIVYLFFTFSLFLLIFNYSWCDIGKNFNRRNNADEYENEPNVNLL